jgi:hypothetical protein
VITQLPYVRRGFGALALSFALAASLPPHAAAQDQQAKPEEKQDGAQADSPQLTAIKRLAEARSKKPADWNGEDVAVMSAFAYRGLNVDQFKKVVNTGREEGRITIATTTGELDGEFLRRYSFGPKMAQDRVRLDIIFEPNATPDKQLRYTLTHNGASVWAAQAGSYVTPDAAAAAAFKASILNDYTALIRYADEDATLTRLPKTKIQGLELEVVEMARADGSKVKFYISPKSYKILHVEYDVVLVDGQNPTNFRETYSDWRVTQEVLVPGKRVLRQNGQIVQTIDLLTSSYGMTHDDSVFLQL